MGKEKKSEIKWDKREEIKGGIKRKGGEGGEKGRRWGEGAGK